MQAVLDALLPMHLRLAADGAILSMGPTLRRLCGNGNDLGACFRLGRSDQDEAGTADFLAELRAGRRIFLRPAGDSGMILRGSGIVQGDELIANLGFGNSLVRAVQNFDLSDSDFAASDLALELLFLHEANQAVLAELNRFHRRLAEAHEKAERQALTDPLTGLLNRRGLSLAFEAFRAVKTGFWLAQLDLDGFKGINDRFGHAAGDLALRHVGMVLHSEIRARDRAVRVGGDEFVLLLAGNLTPAEIKGVRDRILHRIGEPLPVDGGALRLSASWGASHALSGLEASLDRMLNEADARLYAAKSRHPPGPRPLTTRPAP